VEDQNGQASLYVLKKSLIEEDMVSAHRKRKYLKKEKS
jgi:hypothetical protein